MGAQNKYYKLVYTQTMQEQKTSPKSERPENRKSELPKSSTLPIFTYQALYKFNNLTWHLRTPPKTTGHAVSNRGGDFAHPRFINSFLLSVNTPSAFAAKGKHGWL